MLVNERMLSYVESLIPENTGFLEQLEKEAIESYVPIIRKETQQYLKTFLQIQRPKTILEVGTAVGFSAILMAQYSGPECRITTIENFEKRIPIANENFRKAGLEDRISLIEGDAARVLKQLEGSFDLILMDAAKGQYIYYLPEVLRLMHAGSVLISDNVLQEGDLVESHFLVERRNRTIYKRMREYLYTLTHHEELETVLLPIGDGMTISVKR